MSKKKITKYKIPKSSLYQGNLPPVTSVSVQPLSKYISTFLKHKYYDKAVTTKSKDIPGSLTKSINEWSSKTEEQLLQDMRKLFINTKDAPTMAGAYVVNGKLIDKEKSPMSKVGDFLQEDIKSTSSYSREPGEYFIKTKKEARLVFDKVTYPLVTIIPEKDRFKWNGIKFVVQKYLNDGSLNCIRYYTKQKHLTLAQCEVLKKEDDYRSIYGYLINDKEITKEHLNDYIKYLDKYHSKELSRDYGGDFANEREYQAYRQIAKYVPVKSDGSRQPLVIQMGVNSYMKRNSLTNPVQIIDAHVKKEKLKIYDAQNLGGVLGELNITPQEAFDYVCSYLSKNKDIKRKHTQDRELNRGSGALKKLLDFFEAEKERTRIQKITDKKVKIFGYRELMDSKEYADYCIEVEDTQIRVYNTFKDWFKKKRDAAALINKK